MATPTIPSTEHVMKKRHATRRRLRFMALVLLLIGVWWPIYWLIEGLIQPSGNYFDLFDLEELMAWPAAWWLIALPLWLLDRPLARLLVPRPTNHCPYCGYSLQALTRPECSECGAPLPASLVAVQQDDG